eukprot:TRINITY_DN88213_c1_g1_i1.p1 TRINITY_DN88213_c1_g1~~TRINITY_DN88213_c1_g1_i1.p1  ORF type:complete len:483 (+),score=50.69 TRINITY_DN88213_c1_g1_i1:1495-2943(+)
MSSFEGMENSGYGKRSGSRQGFGDISGIVTIRDCFNTFNVNVFDKPTENFFDVKSNKKLDYILRHGYSFKYHEKKHFNAKKSVDAFKKANKDFLNMTMQNKSLMNYMQPKPLSKENSLSMSMSSQNLYAELFNDRYRKLTQNIMFNAQDPEMPQQNELIEESKGEVVSEELNNAKRNRMYKDLGMNLNLREIFGGLSYEDLTKLKKLHVLHATQRAKQKERDQQEAKQCNVLYYLDPYYNKRQFILYTMYPYSHYNTMYKDSSSNPMYSCYQYQYLNRAEEKMKGGNIAELRLGIADDEVAKKIMEGFTINWMSMKDATTGTVHWRCDTWDNNVLEKTETLPKALLKCKAVAREINFTSKEEVRDFQLVQRVWLGDQIIEDWWFKFGFVIPNSTNTWEQTIEAAAPEEMLPIEVINGNVVIETLFLAKGKVIYRSKVRILYQQEMAKHKITVTIKLLQCIRNDQMCARATQNYILCSCLVMQ